MFEVRVTDRFSAAHRLRGYRGKCVRQHGHNWEVEVRVRGVGTDGAGMLVDFSRVKKAVKRVLARLDHSDLNRSGPFRRQNPTSESIARYLFGKLAGRLDTRAYRVHRVCVRETEGTEASYWDSGPTDD